MENKYIDGDCYCPNPEIVEKEEKKICGNCGGNSPKEIKEKKKK